MSETYRGEWAVYEGVRCVECPVCAFTFDADHTTATAIPGDPDLYSCPNCGEASRDAQITQLREALEGVEAFYPEALNLIRELREDAERGFVPGKGYPPHIEKARDLGDHEQVLADVRAALAASDPAQQATERWAVSCGCDYHGDHLGCDETCKRIGCEHPVGVEVTAASEAEANERSVLQRRRREAQQEARCERCDGSGVAVGERHGETTADLVEDPCSACSGTGRAQQEETR